jgi:hypothetical protein
MNFEYAALFPQTALNNNVNRLFNKLVGRQRAKQQEHDVY